MRIKPKKHKQSINFSLLISVSFLFFFFVPSCPLCFALALVNGLICFHVYYFRFVLFYFAYLDFVQKEKWKEERKFV